MKEDGDLLRGIVEADETYLGGKTRSDDRVLGRSRKRKVVLGAVEHGSMVKASLSPRVTARFINMFLRKNIDPRSNLMTDQWPSYNAVRDWMQHLSVNHNKAYVDGII